jgi:hypothetical protein
MSEGRDAQASEFWRNTILKTATWKAKKKWDDLIQGWRKLYNERSIDLHSSPNMLRIVKQRRMR